MRIVFMGTPQFAVPTLDALVAAGHEVVAAYTQPPRPGGRRGRALVPSPVQQRAGALGVPVRSPVSLKGADEQAAFAALDADVGVVAAYGLILPRAVLDVPRLGCLNVHGSLLPRWRGAAPVQRAILAGDEETGVGIMQMEVGLDTGPVRLEGRTAVDGKTAGALTAELATRGAELMVRVLANIDAYPAVPQPEEGVTYAAKIDKAEARIDWSQSSMNVERLVRAMNPMPGAWFETGGERVKVLAAKAVAAIGAGRRGPISRYKTPGTALDFPHSTDMRLAISCGHGFLMPTLLQRAGGKPTTVDEFQRGRPILPDTQL